MIAQRCCSGFLNASVPHQHLVDDITLVEALLLKLPCPVGKRLCCEAVLCAHLFVAACYHLRMCDVEVSVPQCRTEIKAIEHRKDYFVTDRKSVV